METIKDNLRLGTRLSSGYETEFSLSQADRRQHVLALGKSGSGKTTLLRNMILQDVAAGRGVCVIDPHGDLAADVLDHIPSWRTRDVIVFDPSDAEHPVGLNPLARVPPESRPLVASGVVSALKGVWHDSWGPRLEYILYAAVAAVLDCENASLLSVQRMLSDAPYRAWVVRQARDPMVRAFWEGEFELYDGRFMREAVAPIQNKLGQVLMSPLLRNVLGQVRSRVDARGAMDRGRIFVASLPKGRLGEDKAGILGALLLSQFHLAAMSRLDLPPGRRRDFAIYVDEFHSFATDSLASMLAEARKFGVSVALASQGLGPLRPGVRDAVLANVGSVVAFRVGPQDAEALRGVLGHMADELAGLGNGEVVARVLQGGRVSEPFRGRTYAPWGRRFGRAARILRGSRERWATARAKVEGKIGRWAAGWS